MSPIRSTLSARPLRSAVTLGLATTASAVALTTSAADARPDAQVDVDNGRIAFGLASDSDPLGDIYSVRPNGHALRRLTTYPGQDLCAAYSPNGRHLAWCSTRGNEHGGADIWVMKQNGTQQRRVTDMGGNATFPDVHPDGRTVAFSGRTAGQSTPDIWTTGLDGTGLTQLTTDPSVDQFPVYSPDGRQIAFRSNRTGTHQIWVMDADGTDQRPLTTDPAPKDQLPEWSPDGSRIAYAAASAATGLDLWVMDADGGDQRLVLADSDDTMGPAWSPDGSRIAFLNATEGAIQTIAWCGGDVETVHRGGSPAVPAWQPRPDDGR